MPDNKATEMKNKVLVVAVITAAVETILKTLQAPTTGTTIRYDTRCYFNVRSKADISQLNLPHGTDN